MILSGQAQLTTQHHSMLSPGDYIIVGLSGGADSVALLHWLCSIREELKLNLTAAHVNHGLRGQESDDDEAFCRALCEQWQVPIEVKRANFMRFTEEAGRNLRYNFFTELAAIAPKATKIALAHTLSDRVETFLLNIARGTALRGLCSIPPVRQNIVRPLIDCTRTQIEGHCAAHGLDYRIDSTNSDNTYKRNYIRNEVVPRLNWEPGQLRRMFRALEADEAYLAQQAQALEDILSAPEPLKNRALRQRLAEQGREPSLARLKELEKQMRAHTAGTVKQTCPPSSHNFKITELTEILPEKDLANCLDYDTIEGVARFAARQPGDRMHLCNGAGRKSFKKLCQERGISPAVRGHLHVLRDDAGLIWIEGMGCAHRCRVTEETKRVVKIILEGDDG